MANSALRRQLLALLLIGCFAGCGVPMQEEPEGFATPTPRATPSRPPQGVLSATVFLTDDTRLVPVRRPTSDTTQQAVLALLVQGPTAAEADAGLRTALVAGSLDPVVAEEGPGMRGRTVEVPVTEAFTRIVGDDQLLATAQLVWTLTQGSSTRAVQAVRDGRPIELPTDGGLTADPVRRADYRSVAPMQPAKAPFEWHAGLRQ
jgi:Sporulation and spore germination